MRLRRDSLSDLLRARAPRGAPVELLLDSWSDVEDALVADGGRAMEAFTAANRDLPPVAGAIADRRALAQAVTSAHGSLYFAEPAFRALFTDTADLRPLLKRALSEGPVVSLAEGADGAAYTVWIGDEAAAARWPLTPDASAALQAGSQRLVVVVSAPSRSSELARRAARALDLTALEARLAEALLFAPNLEVAAADAGVGRETARDALRRINAKAGVRRAPELIARLIGVMCEVQAQGEDDESLAEEALGLTPGEARVAVRVARGATTPEAAQALSLSPETVKSHMKAVLQKTGAKGAKDLARLFAEGRELVTVASAAEAVFGEEEGGGRLRIVPSLDGARRIALIDYGPYDGEPVFVFHGSAAGRRLPDAYRHGLIRAGLRPIVVQRPGFGLSDPAAGDYAAAAADDMAAVVERLKLKSVRLIVRDTGAPAGLAFASAYPGLLGPSVLMNPHPPMSRTQPHSTFIASVQKHLLRNPQLVSVFAEFLRRQLTTPTIERVMFRALSEVAVDGRALEDPEVRGFLVRDIQAMCARSTWGFAGEHAVYAGGWEPPADVGAGAGWTVAVSAALPDQGDFSWLPIPGVRRARIEGAGVLLQFTHPGEIVKLLA
ncbi:LuxR C-terminal-related transcriptional regulator [Phenylobacterium sp.]|uniref:helix-turn-helix transcriptional regulator n=1 Tax=Phenylobacterium sp. TaxID=1871053 RepID=UPI00301D9267